MTTTIRIIAQQIDTKTQEVVNEHIVYDKEVFSPTKINNLGFFSPRTD